MTNDVASRYVEPVTKRVVVPLPQARAFKLFTASIGLWWQRSHSLFDAASPQVDVRIEPRVGGRWYEVGADGSESEWGHVVAWEPPSRALLAWQLDANWAFDPGHVTEVEVRFERRSAGETELILEHRGLARYGEAAAAVRRELDAEGGWQGLLARCAAEAAGGQSGRPT